MTFSPEARHFETRMPPIMTDQIQRDAGGGDMSAPMTVEHTTPPPASRWRSNWVVANSHWPR